MLDFHLTKPRSVNDEPACADFVPLSAINVERKEAWLDAANQQDIDDVRC